MRIPGCELTQSIMNLDEAQKRQVATWLQDGLKISEIQSRLQSEMNIRMTYMDVRFLVDDLKVMPKDPEPDKPAEPQPEPEVARPSEATADQRGADTLATGRVSLTVDQVARVGTIVSGKVTFSDGNRAEWYLDQTGRLGLAPQQTGYRPSQADLQQFQASLESELSKAGF